MNAKYQNKVMKVKVTTSASIQFDECLDSTAINKIVVGSVWEGVLWIYLLYIHQSCEHDRARENLQGIDKIYNQ